MEYLSSPYNVKGSTFTTKKYQYFTKVIHSLRSSRVLELRWHLQVVWTVSMYFRGPK